MKDNDTFEYLMFPLSIEEDWPPVNLESLPVKPIDGFFEISVPPFFLKNLSCGDIITVDMSSDKTVRNWEYVKKSKRSTIWLLNINNYEYLDIHLSNFKKQKCNIEEFEQIGLFSIDVPQEANKQDINIILDHLEEERVAIAYPSYRL